MKQRQFKDFLYDISNTIDELISFTNDMNYEGFKNAREKVYAVIRCYGVIGEAVKHIPVSVRKKYPEIPWHQMIAMRNKVIHEYFGVDMEILQKTVKSDIFPLKPLIQKVIDDVEINH